VAAAICLPNVVQEVCFVPCGENHHAGSYTFFPKTGEISYNNPFAATKAAADK
jgi:hypothetical protein